MGSRARRPIAAAQRLLVGVAVVSLAVVGCSGGDAGDEWVLVVDEAIVEGAGGRFGEARIDSFLGPERWDVADGAPPSTEDLIAASSLVAAGELRAGAADGSPSELEITTVVAGSIERLDGLDALPTPPSSRREVAIVVRLDETGAPVLLFDPFDDDVLADAVTVLLGGGHLPSESGPTVGQLASDADAVFSATPVAAGDGRVEVVVAEVFRGDLAAGDELSVIVDGASPDAILGSGNPGIWFTTAVGDRTHASITASFPGRGHGALTEALRAILSGA